MYRTLTLAVALTTLFGLTWPATAAEAVVPSAPQSAAAGDNTGVGIRLLDVPAANQDDPRARSYIVDHMMPGSTIQRRIQVVNDSSSAESVRIYSGAALIIDDTFTPSDTPEENDLSRWTSFDQGLVHLAPGEKANVMVTVAVPNDAAEGEQYAAVWAEVRSARTTETNVVSASRVGIRMYVSVGPGNGPAASFEIGQMIATTADDGTRVLTAPISNTGGRALDLNGTLNLADGPAGLSAGPFDSDGTLTVLPGDTTQMSVTLAETIPLGPWMATLQVRSGLTVQDSTSKIIFSEAPQIQDGPEISVPLLIAAGAVTLGLVTGLFLWSRRRLRKISPPVAAEIPVTTR